jgi:hypothetical protein
VMRNMPNWDMSACHPWYFDENSPVTNSTSSKGFLTLFRRAFTARARP